MGLIASGSHVCNELGGGGGSFKSYVTLWGGWCHISQKKHSKGVQLLVLRGGGWVGPITYPEKCATVVDAGRQVIAYRQEYSCCQTLDIKCEAVKC